MKKFLFIVMLLNFSLGFSQKDEQRILSIRNQLEFLATDNIGLSESFKSEIQVNNITLGNFLIALSDIHKVNINFDPSLNSIVLSNNFTNVVVADLLVYLCKEYDLTIDFTGNILSIKPYQPPLEIPKIKVIPVSYNPEDNTISMDIKGDKLYDVFKTIMDASGKNLVFTPDIENNLLTSYLQNTPFDVAMDKLALANDLFMEKSKDDFFIFEGVPTHTDPSNPNSKSQAQRPVRRKNSDFHFKILEPNTKLLEVDFVNTPIADIITEIGNELKIDIFTATPLDNAGTVSFRAKAISFDELLIKIFETHSVHGIVQGNVINQNTNSQTSSASERFTFKKDNDIYFFGTEKQLSVRKVEMIHLQHRSVELLSGPSGDKYSGLSSNRNFSSTNSAYSNYNNLIDNSSNRSPNSPNQTTPRNTNSYASENTTKSDLLNIVPEDIKLDLDFKIDHELNSIYVNGTSTNIERFKKFMIHIDKPVPVVLIEVMIIEVNKNSTVETGVTWGIGEEPSVTKGAVFPEADLTLGTNTVNKIIGSFNDFGSFNIGKVVPNFFATIKAMEANGDLKIRSTPKLATLNGHRATFSNGQTSYYTVTQRNIYGTDNPQTSEITNYVPIDVELGLTIKPLVSGNGQVTLDIYVVQSSFGQRIDKNAPPDINSRNFSSIIRMQDQDIAVLGGLEEQMKNNSGNGVPLLARIPIIKWLFSSRKKESKKAKLTVLIKPTVIY
ncbi:hypothetical protein [Gelidibacter japonicus]|uniref:type II secretion system protein GspD n=1 Tax=Gelidibacter japonicus TaxID=1962232 RepID=UPI002AFEED44|nr:hypothetical protein [Gelidibacter japonicus]